MHVCTQVFTSCFFYCLLVCDMQYELLVLTTTACLLVRVVCKALVYVRLQVCYWANSIEVPTKRGLRQA